MTRRAPTEERLQRASHALETERMTEPRRPGVVIVGTDTGVGKTCVATGLIRALRRWHVAAFPWKPYASGVDPTRVTPGEDADLLLRAADLGPERLADVSPVRYEEPLAPAVAAARLGDSSRAPTPAEVLSRCPSEGDVLVVEGCGGLLVPLAAGYDMRELCWDLNLPVIVVARPGLGTLNHTALTVEAARNAGLNVLGIIVSGFDPQSSDLAVRTSYRELPKLTGAPLLGTMGRVADPTDVDALADAFGRTVDLIRLLVALRRASSPDRADELAEDDRRHVWHPFTQQKQWIADPDPVVIERAKGPWLYDTKGRRYLDGISSLWTNVHGHRVPEIDRAVREQLGKVAHSTLLGLASAPSIELAKLLVEITPKHLTRVFYSDSGSTAVEVGLKMAFQAAKQNGEAQRRIFVRFDGAYHGDTIGAVSLGGIDLFHQVFGPLLFQSVKMPVPYAYRRPEGMSESDVAAASIVAFETFLRERGNEVAAVVVEPVMQGAAGMIPQPKGWLPRIAAATKAADAMLICDEVATGFGRTGTMFAIQHERIEPDILCVAKGITGGYLPLAATITTERVHDAFLGEPHEGRTFFHGHTYTGNPLACAAAIASIRRMLRDDGLGRNAATHLAARLCNTIAPHPNVGDVRVRGLMAGIEIVKDRATKEAFDPKLRVGWRICGAAQDRGVRIRPLGDVVVLMPPLAIDGRLVDHLIDVTALAIDDVLQEIR